MAPYLTVRVVLNTAAYHAEVAFWIGLMGARRVGGWDRGPQDRGVLLELRPAIVVEVVDQSAHDPAATALGTVLACQVAGPDVVDDRYRRMARSLQADAVLRPLGERAWGIAPSRSARRLARRSSSMPSCRVRELECAAGLAWRPAFGGVRAWAIRRA